MKKCPYCNKSYRDSVMRCPEDRIFLLTDTVSDLEEQKSQIENDFRQNGRENQRKTTFDQTDRGGYRGRGSGHRARFQAMNSEAESKRETGDVGDTTPILRPGRIVGSQERREDSDNSFNRRAANNIHTIRRNGGIRRAIQVLRVIAPAILFMVSIILILVFWNRIRPVLSCLAVGAVVGGAAALFLALRFGRNFNIDAVFCGAIVGGLLVCLIRYNILDIGTGLSELIGSLIPIVFILGGIWLAIRSTSR